MAIPAGKQTPAWAKRLEAARTLTGLSQTAFAKALGTYQQRYGQYETGRAEPPFNLLIKIRAMTGVSLDFIIAGVASPEQQAKVLRFDAPERPLDPSERKQ